MTTSDTIESLKKELDRLKRQDGISISLVLAEDLIDRAFALGQRTVVEAVEKQSDKCRKGGGRHCHTNVAYCFLDLLRAAKEAGKEV